jgi:hypothetical protein
MGTMQRALPAAARVFGYEATPSVFLERVDSLWKRRHADADGLPMRRRNRERHLHGERNDATFNADLSYTLIALVR